MFDVNQVYKERNIELLLDIQMRYFEDQISTAMLTHASSVIIDDWKKVQIFKEHFHKDFESRGFKMNYWNYGSEPGVLESRMEISWSFIW